MEKDAVHSYNVSDLQDEGFYTTDIDCDKCEYNGPWRALNPHSGREYIKAMCPRCKQIKLVRAKLQYNGGYHYDKKGHIVVEDRGPQDMSETFIFASAEVKKRKKKTENTEKKENKKNNNTVKTTRVMNLFEPLNPLTTTIAPFTEERDGYKELHKPLQPVVTATQPELVTEDIKNAVKDAKRTISHQVKKELLKEAAMYDAVYALPATQHQLCQWCPKLRRSVSMDFCTLYCPDARRLPTTEGYETYRDYLLAGGPASGLIVCGYKEWLRRELDAYHPGWVEEHVKKRGGETFRTEETAEVRKMNLDQGERSKAPLYPTHYLLERRLEDARKENLKDDPVYQPSEEDQDRQYNDEDIEREK